jgi:hypothetical protein
MRKNIGRFKLFQMLALAIMFMFITALPVMAASDWAQKIVRFPATAGETLVAGNVVCISTTDGKAYKADANDSALRPAIGIIGKGGATNATVEIVVEGILTGQTQVSPGQRLYLSETAGALTITEPTNAQLMGWVLPGNTTATIASSGRYFIRTQMPSSAGAAY